MLWVKAIPGEPTGFWVESNSLQCIKCSRLYNKLQRKLHVGGPCPHEGCDGTLDLRFHKVDIANWNQNGECSCEYFQIKLAPVLSRLPLPDQGAGLHRCHHIRAAREFALDVSLRAHERDRYAHAGRQREEQ